MGPGGSGEDVAFLLEQQTREIEALRAELVVERNKADGVEEKILRRVSNKTNQMVRIPSRWHPYRIPTLATLQDEVDVDRCINACHFSALNARLGASPRDASLPTCHFSHRHRAVESVNFFQNFDTFGVGCNPESLPAAQGDS